MVAQPSVHQLYKRLETIGKGAYGSVHKGQHIPTGNLVALKIINLDDKSGSDDVGDIQREVALLTQLRDAPNITKYFGCYMDGPRVWIVMELAQGGSVLSLMKASRGGCLEEKYVSIITREVLVALSYLHKVPVIHRDIKAANVLVAASGKVIICDFGVSALLATSSSKRNTLTGTPHWMAPEVLQSLPVYDTKADIWSLGIVIYEMIKGSPPHSNIMENIKVMDLIPKVKPPRLLESDGGKDMRDFMAMCLRESPSERLPADELAKSKWIKSVSKVNVSILKDLVLRLEQAERRASLAEPLDWEEEEERDLLHLDVQDENPWEFETVRGRSFSSASYEDDNEDTFENENDTAQTQSTIRPPQSTPLPSSLRLLFEDEATSPQDTLRPPAFQIPHPTTPSPPNSLPPSLSSSPARERIAIKRAATLDNLGDELTAKQGTFVYPPRGMGRSRSKLSSSVPGSEDESSGPASIENTTRSRPSPSPDPSAQANEFKKPLLRDPYKELRSNRFPPNIEIPSRSNSGQIADLSSPAPSLTSESNSSPERSTPRITSRLTRKASESTPDDLTPHANVFLTHRDVNLASPTSFQFPPSPKVFTPLDPGTSSSQKSRSRLSPTHLSTSSPLSSPSSHQSTYSLDISASTRRAPTHNALMPPSITRTRSATALPQATLYPIESPLLRKAPPIDEIPLVPPVKPFARAQRNRSGSDASQTTNPGTPGLRDVLKIPSLTSEHHLGMSDLLPPSPSTAAYTPRSFLASPSQLGSSVSGSDPNRQFSAFRDAASSTTSSFSLGLPRSTSPSEQPRAEFSLLDRAGAHSRKPSAGTATTASSLGPPVRPLDYSMLISQDNTHAELARTIDDLSKWLTIVEVGLGSMLDKTSTNTIAEEQEVSTDPEDEDLTSVPDRSFTGLAPIRSS